MLYWGIRGWQMVRVFNGLKHKNSIANATVSHMYFLQRANYGFKRGPGLDDEHG